MKKKNIQKFTVNKHIKRSVFNFSKNKERKVEEKKNQNLF